MSTNINETNITDIEEYQFLDEAGMDKILIGIKARSDALYAPKEGTETTKGAQDKADAALDKAKEYVDKNNGTHNSDGSAHSDIRKLISDHTSNLDIHVTSQDKSNWNNKVDADYVNNVINNSNSTHNTDTNTHPDIRKAISDHTSNLDIHVTANDKTNWNNKVDASYVDSKITEIQNNVTNITKIVNEHNNDENAHQDIRDLIFSPKDYITFIDQKDGAIYTLKVYGGKLVLTRVVEELVSITISKMPDKTVYTDGELFDPTGMIVTGTDSAGNTHTITNYTFDPEVLKIGDTKVTIIVNDVNRLTAEVPVTVTEIVDDFDPEFVLIDFYYTNNGDGTYTITDWKGTLNGVPSNEVVVPDDSRIIL